MAAKAQKTRLVNEYEEMELSDLLTCLDNNLLSDELPFRKKVMAALYGLSTELRAVQTENESLHDTINEMIWRQENK